MSTATERCPPATQCIDGLIRSVEVYGPAINPESAGICLKWLREVRGSPEAVKMLEQARQAGADVPRLLAVAATFWTGSGWLQGMLVRVTIGPVSLAPECLVDVDRLFEGIELAEGVLGRPSADRAEAEELRRCRDELNAEVARGDVHTIFVFDGETGVREVKHRPTGSFITKTTLAAGIEQGALHRPGRGAHGDQALTVVAMVVSGHMQAVTGERHDGFAAAILVEGLLLGIDSSATPEIAMRMRIGRVRRDEDRASHRTRAARIAAILCLRYRLD